MRGNVEQDSDLIQQAIAGDNVAYWKLIERNKRLVYWACNKYLFQQDKKDSELMAHQIGVIMEEPLFSREQIDDIAHEIFLLVYNGLNKFKGESKFSTWLCEIAKNHCKNMYSKARSNRKKRLKFDIENADATDLKKNENILFYKNPADAAVDEIDAFTKCVQGKIALLNEKHKIVIDVVHYAQRTYEEAAEILKCPIGTIRSRLSRALEKLEPLVRECLPLRRG